ncbi:hypothetical protein PFISCL1PPCAC_8634, partial [Pristionchus fissidentatus]
SKMRVLVSLLLIGAAAAAAQEEKQPEGPPCGLPPFVDVLPEKQSKDMRDTWAAYKEGGTCTKEQAATHAIIATLSAEEHRAVFGGDDIEIAPLFIQKMTAADRKTFDGIFWNPNLEDADKQAKINKMAESFKDADQLADFGKWKADQEAAKKAYEARVAKLSPAVKTQYDKLVSLRREAEKLRYNLSPEAREELGDLIR